MTTEPQPRPQPAPRKVFFCAGCGDMAEGDGPLCPVCTGELPKR